MLRPDWATVAYRRLCVTLLSVYWGINRVIPWQVLQYALTGHVRPPSGFGPGLLSILCPLSPATHKHTYTHTYTHTHTHTLSDSQPLTAAPLRQHQVLFLPPQNPGCPSRQESKASLKPERVNEAEERKREQRRPSPTSLLPVLLFAR